MFSWRNRLSGLRYRRGCESVWRRCFRETVDRDTRAAAWTACRKTFHTWVCESRARRVAHRARDSNTTKEGTSDENDRDQFSRARRVARRSQATQPMLRARRRPDRAASSSGWQLPPDADARQSPLTADAKVLAAGKASFKDKCTRCHGRRASTVPTPIRITARHGSPAASVPTAIQTASCFTRCRTAGAGRRCLQGRTHRTANLVRRRLRTGTLQEIAIGN